ncbi:MAG: chemotaxis response regulator protein-glutamate methylesterase [Clostridia bacterium]|nr:chemotaxis response regulator protein-glutamate methylesterase [Clostridia bacterium]
MIYIKRIRVLVIDDSLVFREVISKLLSADENIEIVGTAADPIEAMDKIKVLKPDVLTLDVHMPKMNGIDFLKKLMAESPMPVVVVSSVSGNVFDALNAGAVEFVTKPTEGKKADLFGKELIIKTKIASIAKLNRESGLKNTEKTLPNVQKVDDVFVIAIGASTGGTEAILSVIKDLPENTPGIVIVQHMPAGFTKMYSERADRICRMRVKEAQNGDRIETGLVLIAPGELQMKVKKDKNGYYVSCEKGEKVSGHAPSVDVLFHSVADAVGEKAVGIILTGMGSDGASGLLHMKNKGAYTIGQDEKSCVVYGMPKVSQNIGAVRVQASLNEISRVLIEYLQKH